MSNDPTSAKCGLCGGEYEFASQSVLHAPDCPQHVRNLIGSAHAANIASLALARADKGSKPREHPAAEALDLARDWIRECGPENEPHHVIVFLGRTNGDNSSGTKYFQTGNFSSHAQVGLVIEGLHMLQGHDDD